jgi:hypothetical protein
MQAWPGKFTVARTLLHALMRFGKNDFELDETEFMAASIRFGVHNPVPHICRRLANFGNVEEV